MTKLVHADLHHPTLSTLATVGTPSTEPQAHTSTEYTPINSCIIEAREDERGKRGIKPEEDERTFRTASWKVDLCLGCSLYAEIRRVSRQHQAEAQDSDLVAAAKQPRPVLQTAT